MKSSRLSCTSMTRAPLNIGSPVASTMACLTMRALVTGTNPVDTASEVRSASPSSTSNLRTHTHIGWYEAQSPMVEIHCILVESCNELLLLALDCEQNIEPHVRSWPQRSSIGGVQGVDDYACHFLGHFMAGEAPILGRLAFVIRDFQSVPFAVIHHAAASGAG